MPAPHSHDAAWYASVKSGDPLRHGPNETPATDRDRW
jgi:hypothetical protein